MNSERQIEDALRRAARQLSRDASMNGAIMSRIERLIPPQRRHSRTGGWFIFSVSTAAAAVVVLTVHAWFLLSAGVTTLAFADVVEALEKIRTARYETEVSASGERITCLYERGVGIRLEGTMEGTAFVLVDNGKRQWVKSGEDVKESDSSGLITTLRKALLSNEYLDGAKHQKQPRLG